MQLTYYGNAMMLLEGAQSSVLCDPWVTFDRTSYSGLYTFPELRLTKEQVAAINPDFIYITHTHEDHFDPVTLALFSKDTPILVSYYDNNFTERHVRELGFTDVRVADPETGLPLNGGDHCWIEPNGIYSDVDSLGVFRIDGYKVLNANDNPFCAEQCASLAQRFGRLDLACVPFSFQGPYPAFYENLTEPERRQAAHDKKLRNFAILVEFAKALNPRFIFPFAAGAVYGGAKALMSDYYGVGTADEALDYLLQRHATSSPVLLSQLMRFDFETEQRIGDYQPHTYADERAYLEDIAARPGPFDRGGLFFIEPSERIDLTKLLVRARQKQQEWQRQRGIESEAVFFIDVGEPLLYRLCLGDESVRRVAEADIEDAAYEIFRMPYSLLVGLLTHHYNYSNVKTQHMTFYRRPDVFNRDLHILMSFLQL